MTRLRTSFVLGYHGCEESIGRKAVNGETKILQSSKKFDWLGPGAYFWESDPQRAYEWAQEKCARGEYTKPFVIGAVIDLGYCLDLTVREDAELLGRAYISFKNLQERSGLPMPENLPLPSDTSGPRILRFLDCAVVNHLHSIIKEEGGPPLDSVRALLPEGSPLYDGSGFWAKTHVQIAVCNPSCIKSVYYVDGPWFSTGSPVV